MNTEQTQKAKKAAGWVTGLLTGWGIPGTIARILAGAIVGAIATAVALTGTDCTNAKYELQSTIYEVERNSEV